MKIQLSFKTPDVIYNSVSDLNYEMYNGIPDDVDEAEKYDMETEIEEKVEQIKKDLSVFISHNECITVEFDTETKTMEVLKVR